MQETHLIPLMPAIETPAAGLLFENHSQEVLYANETIAALLNTTPQTLIGKNFRDHAASNAQPFIVWAKRLSSTRPIYNHPITLADGRAITCDYIPVSAPDQQIGHMWHIRSAAQDNAILHNLLTHTPITTFKIDKNGIVTHVQGQLHALPNIPPDQVIGAPLSDILQETPKKWIAKQLKRAFAGETFSILIQVQDLSFDVWLMPLYDAQGNIEEIYGIANDITQKRQLEETLHQTEERYRTIIESVSEGIIIFDHRGYITTLNNNARRILGVKSEHLSKAQIAHFINNAVQEDGSPFDKANFPSTKTLETGMPQKDIVIGLRGLGDVITWLSVNTQPIYDKKHSAPHGVVVSFSDITVSKAAAVALQKSEARNKTLLHAIPDMIFVFTRDGLCVEAKAGSQHVFAPEDVIGLYLHQIPIDQSYTDQIYRYIQEVLDTGQGRIYTFEMPTKTSTIIFEIRLALLNEEEVLCLMQDITERKRYEDALNKRVTVLAALERLDNELTQTLDIDYVLSIALDASLRLSGANIGYITLLQDGGIKLAKAYGAYPAENDLIHLVEPLLKRVIMQRKPFVLQDVFADPDYIAIVPATRSQVILPMISQDRIIGILNLESKTSDFFTQETVGFLERVTYRIAVALDNAQLYHTSLTQLFELKTAHDQVTELERLKTQMIRIAAHDLRSPLGVITGYLMLMEEELGTKLEDDAYHELNLYLEPIHRAIKRMQHMTTDILSLERIHASHDHTFHPVEFGELVERAYADHRDYAAQKYQTLTLSYSTARAKQSLRVNADEIQLYEALANLINNAIKYTPVKGIIEIRLAQEGQHAVLYVIDNGIGIPQKAQDKLFEPFYRVKNNDTRNIDGTGLGLYLVKSIIERHHGIIALESQPGKGTQFKVSLPRI